MTGAPGLIAVGRDTLRSLMTQPGRLASDFAAGVKRVGPVKLFVIAAIVFTLVRLAATQLTPPDLSTPAMDPSIRAQLDALPISTGAKENIITTYENRRDIMRTAGWEAAAVMVLLVPVFALLMQVAYSRSGKPYAQHLVFALDYFAAILIAEALSAVVDPFSVTALSVLAGLSVLVWVSWYTIKAMESFYGGTTGETILKATIVGLGYLVVYTALMTSFAAATLYLAERSQ
jgi:hypothetical protein